MENLDEGIRVVILAAKGEHFSAGLDLNDLENMSVPESIAHSRMWHRAFEAIEFGKVPVISVLQGAVIGGGLELMAATHIRVAEMTSYFALPEGQRGLFVGGGGSVRLPRLIGVPRMMDMMLTGRSYNAEEGAALGLVHYTVAAGNGMEKAMELARKIAGNNALSNFAIIQALPRIAEASSASGYMLESLMSAITQANEDATQRRRDFLEKRAAKIIPE